MELASAIDFSHYSHFPDEYSNECMEVNNLLSFIHFNGIASFTWDGMRKGGKGVSALSIDHSSLQMASCSDDEDLNSEEHELDLQVE